MRLKKLSLVAAAALAGISPAKATFDITLSFSSSVSSTQKVYFENAAKYWESQIIGYQGGVSLTGVSIAAEVANIDGDGGILGQAGPGNLESQAGYTFATSGGMQFDSADVNNMIAEGSFQDVITHEMGHVLGIGTLWEANRVYDGSSGKYTGQGALNAWRTEFNRPSDNFVPVELGGSAGTANAHWNEVDQGAGNTGIVSRITGKDFRYELMTGWANTPTFLSTVTLGSLEDMGYVTVIGIYDENGDYLIKSGDVSVAMVDAPSRERKMRKVSEDTATVFSKGSFSGGSSIEAGVLILKNAGALGSGVVVLNGGTLDVGTVGMVDTGRLVLNSGKVIGSVGEIRATGYDVYSGRITARLAGTGALVKSGAGTVVLSGDNAYSGGTVVQSGILAAASATALGSGLLRISGGTLDVGVAHVAGIKSVRLESGSIIGGTGSLSADSFELLAGSVSASLAGGSVRKSGSDTATLSGANTFSGGLTVEKGLLIADGANSLGSGIVRVQFGGELRIANSEAGRSAALIVDTGSIRFSGVTSAVFGSISGDGALKLNNADNQGVALAVGRAGTDTTYAGVLSGAGSVTKVGAGTLTLTGSNRFTGGLVLNGGQISAAAEGSLGVGSVEIRTGKLVLTDASAAKSASVFLTGGQLSFANHVEIHIGGLGGAESLRLENDAGAALALHVGALNADTVFTGTFSGKGSLVKSGGGILMLSGVNTHQGGVSVEDGMLIVTNRDALGSGPLSVTGGTLNIGASTIVAPGAFVMSGGIVGGAAGGRLEAGYFEFSGGLANVSLGGAAKLVVTGDSRTTLMAENFFSEGTEIRSGTLSLGNAKALSSGPVLLSGGELDIGNALVSGVSSFRMTGGRLVGSLGAFDAPAFNLESGEIAARLIGSGVLVKSGTGVVKLSAATARTGENRVMGGVMVISNPAALGSGVTTVDDGAALAVGSGKDTFGASWDGSDIILKKGGRLAFGLSGATLITRRISGDGLVEQAGSGVLTFSHLETNGDVLISGGVLMMELNASPQSRFLTSGTGVLAFRGTGAFVSLARDIQGDGRIEFTGPGSTAIRSSLTHTGVLSVGAGHALILGEAGVAPISLKEKAIEVSASGTLKGAAIWSGSLRNEGVVSPGFSPGTLTFSGDFMNTGILNMEVTDGASDRIRFGGVAYLGGTLNILYPAGVPGTRAPVTLIEGTGPSSAFVGAFDSINLPTGRVGTVYLDGNAVRFLPEAGFADIPTAKVDPRLHDFARAVTQGASASPALASLAFPLGIPVSSLASVARNASPMAFSSAVSLPVAQSGAETEELRRHLEGRRFERASYSAGQTVSPYLSAHGASRDPAHGDADSPVFRSVTYGGTVGVDLATAPGTITGVQLTYDTGRADFIGGGGRLDQDRVCVTGFVSTLLTSRWYVEGGVSVGRSSYDTRRDTFVGRNVGETTGRDWGVKIGTGTVVPLGQSLFLTPHIGGVYTHAMVEGFEETGSPLALRMKDFDYDALAVRAGSGLHWKTVMGDIPFRLGIYAGLAHEILNNEADLQGGVASVSGTDFSTSSVVSAKSRIEFGPEMEIGVSGAGSITASCLLEHDFSGGTGRRFDIAYRMRF